MYNNAKIEAIDNSSEWVNWIEEAIAKNYFKYYEYKSFSNIQKIGSGGFGNVYRANWKSSDQYFALKSFFKPDDATIKEIVNEVITKYNVYFDLFLILLFNPIIFCLASTSTRCRLS